jgi:hypothetical protein
LFHISITTGNRGFAECPIHSTKAGLLSAKDLPRATLGKALTAKKKKLLSKKELALGALVKIKRNFFS